MYPQQPLSLVSAEHALDNITRAGDVIFLMKRDCEVVYAREA